MKALLKARSLRNTLIAAAAGSMIAVPTLASAGFSEKSEYRVTFTQENLQSRTGQAGLYGLLKDASRKLCGSSNLKITGSLRASAEVESCYQETLTAAVDRVAHPAIKELHDQ